MGGGGGTTLRIIKKWKSEIHAAKKKKSIRGKKGESVVFVCTAGWRSSLMDPEDVRGYGGFNPTLNFRKIEKKTVKKHERHIQKKRKEKI